MLAGIKEGGTFLINTEEPADKVFESFTAEMQQTIIDKKIKVYAIDAYKIAGDVGLGFRINTVMQVPFFKLANIIDPDEAIAYVKTAIEKTFKSKGEDIVQMNWSAVDAALEATVEITVPATVGNAFVPPRLVPDDAVGYAHDIIEPLMHLKGDDVPVSKMSFDGVIPTGTTKIEKRGIAPRVPQWISENCIQCNQCVMACPHAVVRAKQIAPADLEGAPEGFVTLTSNTKNDRNLAYKLQIYAEDCTGCGVCVETCPAKTKALEFTTLDAAKEAGEVAKAAYFDDLPDNVTDGVKETTVKGSQFLKPLFEFSGACAGCGETPYVKLVTQLFGDRMVVANATGCSSIYGGTFPTIPYCTNKEGRGPTWANSLFEDNAEYGMGMRLAIDKNRELLKFNVEKLRDACSCDHMNGVLSAAIANWTVKGGEAFETQDAVKAMLPEAIKQATGEVLTILKKIQELQDYFVDKSVWIIGGDGWAYDIGFGGLDHAVASGRNVNILVVDTEVYSNTGGQASKATPIAAVAKFANGGMRNTKKNLGFMCMSYGTVYVASIAMGANRAQTLKAFQEAEAYDGPSIILAYAPCIAHGIDMMKSQVEMKRAVDCGYWPLYRYNPTLEKPFTWETREPKSDFQEFIRSERRYTTLLKTAPDEAEALFAEAEADAKKRMKFYKNMGEIM